MGKMKGKMKGKPDQAKTLQSRSRTVNRAGREGDGAGFVHRQ
jgi:hypothetical protein